MLEGRLDNLAILAPYLERIIVRLNPTLWLNPSMLREPFSGFRRAIPRRD